MFGTRSRGLVGGLVMLLAWTGCKHGEPVELAAPTTGSTSDERSSPRSAEVVRLGTNNWRLDGPLEVVAFTRDASIIVAASQDDGIAVLDASTGEHVRHIEVSSEVSDAVLLADDRTLAVALSDGSIVRHDVHSGETRAPLLEANHGISSIAIDTERRHIAVCGEGPVRVLDVETHAVVARIGDFGRNSSFDACRRVAFVPGTEYVAASTTDRVGLWNVRTGKREHQLPTSQIGTFGVAANGRWIATVDHAGGWIMRVWSLDDGKHLHTFSVERAGVIGSTPDGRVALMSVDGTIAAWRVDSGEPLRPMGPTSSYVRTIAVSADGTMVAAGGNDNTVGLWRLADARSLAPAGALGHRGSVRELSFSPDGHYLVTGSLNDQRALVWTTTPRRSGGRAPVLALDLAGGYAGATFDTESRQVHVAWHGHDMRTEHFLGVELYDGAPLHRFTAVLGLVRGLRARSDAHLAVAEHARISLLEPGGHSPVWSSEALYVDEFGFPDAQVAFDPTGDVAILYGRGFLAVDVTARRTIERVRMPCRHLRSAAVAASGDRVVTIDDEATMVLWRRGPSHFVSEASLLVPESVGAVAIDSSGTVVAYATSSSIQLWAPSDDAAWTFATRRPSALTFAPDGTRLAIGYHNGTIEIWPTDRLRQEASPAETTPGKAHDTDACDEEADTVAGIGYGMMGGLFGSGDPGVDPRYEGMFSPPASDSSTAL